MPIVKIGSAREEVATRLDVAVTDCIRLDKKRFTSMETTIVNNFLRLYHGIPTCSPDDNIIVNI
jgi:hypothetical protein